MKKYSEFIGSIRLIENLDSVRTTGDLDYCGTAVEVSEKNGEELFHIVIDETGERQILFFSHIDNFRVKFSQFKKIIEQAVEDVLPVLSENGL